MTTEITNTDRPKNQEAIVLTHEDLAKFEELHQNIATFMNRVLPHIHEEWFKIEPKLKVAFNRLKTDFEKTFSNLEKRFKEASDEAQLETNTVLLEISKQFESILEDTSKSFIGYISESPETKLLIENFTESSTEIDKFLKSKWDSLEFKSNEVVDSILEIENIIDILENEIEENQFDTLLNFSKSNRFRDILLANYQLASTNNKRSALIDEAFQLHCLGYYAGSTTLLYSQIEGVITDTLIDNGYAKWNKNRLITTQKTKDKLPGLSAKLHYASSLFEHTSEIFSELLDKKIIDNPNNQTLSFNRNIVLHGNHTNFAESDYSLKLILCLFSLILKVRLIYSK